MVVVWSVSNVARISHLGLQKWKYYYIILNIKFNNYILEKNMARARKEGQVCGSRIRVGW